MGRFAVERNSENHAPTTPVPTGAAFDLAPNFGPSSVAPWRSIRTTGRMTIDAHPSRWSSARFEDCRRSMGNLITLPIMSLLMAQQEPMRPSKAQGNQFACVLVHTQHSFVASVSREVRGLRGGEGNGSFMMGR